MVFNVFFDPKVIDVAVKGEALGIAALTGILQGLLTNCVLCDFEDARSQTEIGQRLKDAVSTYDLSLVKRLLAVLAKRNRFVFVIPADYYNPVSELDQAAAVAEHIPLDLILTEETPTVPVPSCTVIASLAAYSGTSFEVERSARAANGVVFVGGEYQSQSFLDLTLLKALRHASRIDICDRILGQKFGDNFEHTIKQLFTWFERNLVDPKNVVVTIHCGKTEGRAQHFLRQLATFRTGRISEMPVTVKFYENPSGDSCLPHQRYIQTDQFAFSVDRGMDFLNKATGANRDVSIDLKNESDVAKAIAKYASLCIATNAI